MSDNYTFLDASGSTQTAASSVVGGVNFPIVRITTPVSVVGAFTQTGIQITSVSGLVEVNSVIGTYAEDSQHNTGDKGFFALGVRNDTLSSITSNDNDYSPIATGPVGEAIFANSPITKWISGATSTVSGSAAIASVLLFPAQGASVFSYLTSAQIVNTGGSVGALITFTSGGSVLGYAGAPVNTGQSNPIFVNPLKSRPNFSIDISASAASSIISISAQGFISKT